MATASPTPLGPGSHFTSLGRRTSARQALRRPTSRTAYGRSESNAAEAVAASSQAAKSHAQPQYSTLNDSSDDEIPVPMKLSALTKALLGDGHANSEASSQARSSAHDEGRPTSPSARPASRVMTRRSALSTSTSSNAEERPTRRESTRDREARRQVRAGSVALSSRGNSPARSQQGSSPVQRKRIVRLTQQAASGILQQGVSLPSRQRRSLSTSQTSAQRRRQASRERSVERERHQSEQYHPPHHQQQPDSHQSFSQRETRSDINTPSVPVRTVRIVVGSSGGRGRSGGSSSAASCKPRSGGSAYSDQEGPEPQVPETVGRAPPGLAHGSVSRFSASVRKAHDLDAAPASSMRSMKRVTKIPGSFLSGPARRGKRRQSEEDAENAAAAEAEAEAAIVSSLERESHQADGGNDYEPHNVYLSSFREFAATERGSPVSAKDPARLAVRRQTPPGKAAEEQRESMLEAAKSHLDLPAYKVPAPPPAAVNVPSGHDKENEIPIPSYKSSVNGQVPLMSVLEKEQNKLVPPLQVDRGDRGQQASVHASPDRKALAPKSQNQPTPHRVAPPPPPKMSVVETATKAAGAGVTSKKRAVLMRVNDRVYTRIECVGRGGSGKVYRVSAENGSMYALKRVSIEHADEHTVKGFKGEIDLLKRLTGVERVIQLYDWEMNEEKQMLSLLMEVGELDFNTVIKSRLGQEGHRLDTVFVKFFWKEMLECLASVHAKDIVHSDLKPANFVLVKGRLKLIDFGIANAIQTDETVNVHRENQVGTPSYMSPESLMDSNHYAFVSASHNGHASSSILPPPALRGKKLTKLGKPSDVWSLGIILYQMVYGETPFAHIANQMSRCQAIINWNHPINFPDKVGNVRVPLGLIRTMKRCLNREQKERPTCEELLAPTDPFLYPQEFDPEIFGVGEGRAVPVTEELLGRIIQSVVQRCRERMPTDGEAMSAWPSAYWASVKKNVGIREP